MTTTTLETTEDGAPEPFPLTLGLDTFGDLIYDHDGLTAVLPEIGALALFAAVLSALALRAYARTVYSPG